MRSKLPVKHAKGMFRKDTKIQLIFLPERIPKMSKTRILKMEQKNDLIKFLSRTIFSLVIIKYLSAYIQIKESFLISSLIFRAKQGK